MTDASLSQKQRILQLHEMRPWRGLAQTALRLGVFGLLAGLALRAFAAGDYAIYAVFALATGVWFGGAMSLTHDALHHRLTGIRTLDEIIARIISWPIAWPIGTYARVHWLHHRWSGASMRDPERLQPTQREYEAAPPFKRWYYRNQVWFNILVAGAFGMLLRLLSDVWRHREQLPGIGRTALIDAAGIAAVLGVGTALVFELGGWSLVGAVAGLWIAAERSIGVVHQVRNHAEHYGLWGARATLRQAQYRNARDIDTSPLVAWYFNQLNRHATHHVMVGVPYYKLEAAHRFLRAAFEEKQVPFERYRGYLAQVLFAHDLARRRQFIVETQAGPA